MNPFSYDHNDETSHSNRDRNLILIVGIVALATLLILSGVYQVAFFKVQPRGIIDGTTDAIEIQMARSNCDDLVKIHDWLINENLYNKYKVSLNQNLIMKECN